MNVVNILVWEEINESYVHDAGTFGNFYPLHLAVASIPEDFFTLDLTAL